MFKHIFFIIIYQYTCVELNRNKTNTYNKIYKYKQIYCNISYLFFTVFVKIIQPVWCIGFTETSPLAEPLLLC